MKKKEITDRLQLLNGGRTHYLDFLRNLTPQIILLSIIILMSSKFDLPHIDITNIYPTFIFLTLITGFFLALYANSSLLYERCFSELKIWFAELKKALSAQNIKGVRRLTAIIKAIYKEQFLEFIEMIFILFFLQITIAIIIVMSFHSASSIWRTQHPV